MSILCVLDIRVFMLRLVYPVSVQAPQQSISRLLLSWTDIHSAWVVKGHKKIGCSNEVIMEKARSHNSPNLPIIALIMINDFFPVLILLRLVV